MELKQYTTLKERADAILSHTEELASECYDQKIESSNLFREENRPEFTEFNGDQVTKLDISTHAEGQLLGRLNIQGSYLHRCPNWLQALNVNYWLRAKNRSFLVRFKGETVRAIFSPRHCGDVMDDKYVVPIVLDALQKEQSTEDTLHLKDFIKDEDITILRSFYKDLKVEQAGLAYFGGVQMLNSEIGKSSLWIKPTVRVGSFELGSYDLVDKLREGCTSFKHVGELKEAKLREAVRLAKEVCQVGITQLIKCESETDTWGDVKDFIQKADNLPTGRLCTILDEQMEETQSKTKMQFARIILDAVKELPTFKKYLAEAEVGRYLDLFRNTKKRMQNIIDAQEG